MELLQILAGAISTPMGFMMLVVLLFFFSIVLLHNMSLGLFLLIFSIPLSPEISGIFGSDIPVRIDDILIIALFLVWIMKLGTGSAQFYGTPLSLPVIIFFLFMIASTFIGYAFKHTITDLKYPVLVLLKNFEYFAIFFLVANNIQTRKQIRTSINYWMIAYFFVIIYGIVEHNLFPTDRLYEHGLYDSQSNHMGGYLMITTTMAIGLFFSTRQIKAKLIYFLLVGMSLYTFIFNQSKESYISFSVSFFLVFLILRRRFLLVPLVFILAVFVMIPHIYPYSAPAESIEVVKQDTLKLSINKDIPTSADIRRDNIAYSIQSLPENPFVGRGTGFEGMARYESQIAMLLIEGGIIGAVIFLWLIFRILIYGSKMFITLKDLYFKCLSGAFLAAFFGVLVQSVACTAWMITFIMGPFWFFAGIMAAIDRVNKRELHAV